MYGSRINSNYNAIIFTVLIIRRAMLILLLGLSFALLFKISNLLFELNSQFNDSLNEEMGCLFTAAPKLLLQ
jgi:hypothetical protein